MKRTPTNYRSRSRFAAKAQWLSEGELPADSSLSSLLGCPIWLQLVAGVSVVGMMTMLSLTMALTVLWL